MKPQDIRENNTSEELATLEADLRRKLWKAKFDNFTNGLDDTSEIKKLKRDIARVKTVLSERSKTESTEASE